MSDGELRQTMRRLMSIHDEIDEKKLDLKTVYADAKSAGFDKTALGLAIRQIRGREKNETPAAQERSAMVELYVSAFDNAPRTYVHVPAREAAERQNPSEGEVGSAVRTGAPASAIEYQPARLSAERDPQSAHDGSDSEGGAGGGSPLFVAGSEQESAIGQQARNEPGSEAAASGGEGPQSLPETPAIKGLAAANATAAKATALIAAQPRRSSGAEMPDIPEFLRLPRESTQPMGEQA